MDSENRLIEWIKEIEPFLTEDYLLTLTNKGIYNRAHKDLEKIRDEIKIEALEEETLKVILGEETTVLLKNPINNSECSCPAQNICRHIMTALLYCKQFYEANKEITGQQNKLQNKLQEIDLLSNEALQKLFGKKIYNEAIKKQKDLEGVEITYGKLVTIEKKGKFTVYFTLQNTLEQAVCSCKSKGLCLHKLQAIMGYLKQEQKREFIKEKAPIQWTDQEEECVRELKEAVADLLDKGLANLTESMISKVEMLYIKAYNHHFYEVSNDLKYLSGELGLYFLGNAAFKAQKVVYSLCRIYNRLEAMQYHHTNPEKLEMLLGHIRTESIEEESLSLIGLGKKTFLSKRKDLVITAYFYCKEYERILSVSTLRPLTLDSVNSIKRAINQEEKYLSSAPLVWKSQWSFEAICHQKIRLQDAVIRGEKISATAKTGATLEGYVTEEERTEVMCKDYTKLKQQLVAEKQDYFKGYGERQNVYLIRAKRHTPMKYNDITQRLEWWVYDENEEKVLFYLPFNPVTEDQIQALERREISYAGFVGQFYLRHQQLEAELCCLFEREE